MLLTITNTTPPATDLGYLLGKNPGRAQSFPFRFGTTHVFYPEAAEERCTAALLLDVDTVGLVRGPGAGLGEHYINDRPYAASSLLSVAIARVFRSAMAGRCPERPQLALTELPLKVKLAALPARGDPDLIRKLFEPLGYDVTVMGRPLDEAFPEWGQSPYFAVTLEGMVTVKDLMTHLYVLVPVLDDSKHYWVGDDEVDKLLQKGEGWLARHPEVNLITGRYLKNRRSLMETALARLLGEEQRDSGRKEEEGGRQEEVLEKPIGLGEQRVRTVVGTLKELGAQRVIDLGCGEGRLLDALLRDRSFESIVGVDVSHRALEKAKARLHLDGLPPRQAKRIMLMHGSLTYRDRRFTGYDVATLLEVVEHLDPPRLQALERVVFEFAKPQAVILTTPNHEYNVKWEKLPVRQLRHEDHRFEWTREEFREWAEGIARRFDYSVEFKPIGPDDPGVGPPTQMGVFRR